MRCDKKGSVLILAMLLAAAVAVAIGSFLKTSSSHLKLANRSFYQNAAMNIAENGLEDAMYASNRYNERPDTYSWASDGWALVDGTDQRKKFVASTSPSLNLGQNVTGTSWVRVRNFNSFSPTLLARSAVTLRDGSRIEKWVEITISRTSRFANGLVARNNVTFSGNAAVVDSWNSRFNNDGTLRASQVGYSAAVKKDNGSVGSTSVEVNAALIDKADVYGYVSTGGPAPVVGNNGLIGPFGTPMGTVVESRVSTSFTSNFDNVEAPNVAYTSLASITSNTDLPRNGDVAINGVFYYEASEISMSSGFVRIRRRGTETTPRVVIKLTNASQSISFTGTARLQIDDGARLDVYAPGDMDFSSGGVVKGGNSAATIDPPERFVIWGTSTTSQDIKIGGSYVFSGCVYAPNAAITIRGNTDVSGSFVGNTIDVAGSAFFHYDEALAAYTSHAFFRIQRWREITSQAERDSLLSLVNW